MHKKDTVCVHPSRCPRAAYGSITTPIFQAATFVHEGVGVGGAHYDKFAHLRALSISSQAAFSLDIMSVAFLTISSGRPCAFKASGWYFLAFSR